MTIMKKFLSIAIAAVMLVAAFSVVALAEAPKAEEFTANNGFFIFEGKENKTDVQDPATLADTDKGLQIIHGGYYQSGDNCGGVVSNEMYGLDGFEATVYFEKAPEVDSSTDCWVAFDFLKASRPFFTGNFNVENGGNQGILNLVRFGKPYIEFYEGITGFSGTYNSQSVDATVNAMFSITSGTTLTVKLARTETGAYEMTFAREGFEDFTIPYTFEMQDVFPDGEAYFSVIASCEVAGEDGWTYYITDIKEGTPLTEEEKTAIAEAKAAAELAEKIEAATKETGKAEEKAKEALERAEATGDAEAIAKAQDAVKAVEDSYAAIEAEDVELAAEMSDLARDYAKEANDLSKAAEKADDASDNKSEEKKDTASNVDSADDTEESAGFPVWAIVLIIVVVAAIVVVAVVVSKKKK